VKTKRQKKQKGPGRPTKFTPRNVQRILSSIALGASIRLAGLSAGVDEDTIHLWMKRGEREGPGSAYFGFSAQMKEREGLAVKRWLKVIDDSAKHGNWCAAAWKLERLHPEQYSRPPLVRIEPQHLSDDELENRIRSLVHRTGLVGLASSKPGKAPPIPPRIPPGTNTLPPGNGHGGNGVNGGVTPGRVPRNDVNESEEPQGEADTG